MKEFKVTVQANRQVSTYLIKARSLNEAINRAMERINHTGLTLRNCQITGYAI